MSDSVFNQKHQEILEEVLDVKLNAFRKYQKSHCSEPNGISTESSETLIKLGESVEKSIFTVKKIEQQESKNNNQKQMVDHMAEFLENVQNETIRSNKQPVEQHTGEIPTFISTGMVLNEGETILGKDDVTLETFREENGMN